MANLRRTVVVTVALTALGITAAISGQGRIGSGSSTGPLAPITYEVDGTQYVAFGGGLGRAATVVGPNDATVENAPMLFVFALGGKAKLPEKPPTTDVPTPSPAGPAPEQRNQP